MWCRHSVQFKYGWYAKRCQVTRGDYLCILSPKGTDLFFLRQEGEWTRRDSNPHLRLGQSAMFPLHHGPCILYALRATGLASARVTQRLFKSRFGNLSETFRFS